MPTLFFSDFRSHSYCHAFPRKLLVLAHKCKVIKWSCLRISCQQQAVAWDCCLLMLTAWVPSPHSSLHTILGKPRTVSRTTHYQLTNFTKTSRRTENMGKITVCAMKSYVRKSMHWITEGAVCVVSLIL